MGKLLRTKMKILELLERRNMTVTELSQFLQVSPSTVDQHVKELAGMGMVERIESEFARKWKYYTLARPVKDEMQRNPPIMILRKTSFG
ncbi:MAG: winged helix-turn-helix transcriptional regulator [Candidatus Micrarchaeota archaeon]|nr:winged helix-turn-helix transcriptional regulator [Candidatus Micrarchaeota archaeon]MDE1824484.1 winged helix-turn-helix transcriptional regulator [Candidatus Micrarchaeota archaeon]MDE1849773.1 winged helix-turn-helix transcriptional regulator [Candidatus Micrarchaeota archaeon]